MVLSCEDMAERSACLDAERIEVACLRQDIIDEYEKKSAELLDYLSSMETAFEQQRIDYEQRECCLKQQNKELKKLIELEHKSQCRLQEERERRVCEAEQELQEVRDHCRRTERALTKEQRRAEELETVVEELQQELHRREEEACYLKRKEKKCRERAEQENKILKQKATLGWMLGCLYELYMRLDPNVGTGSAIKLVRKLQRDLEYESFHQTGDSSKVDYDLIEKEIRRLVSRAQASLKAATAAGSSSKGGCCLLKDCASRNRTNDLSLGEVSEERRKICKSKSARAQKEARELSEGLGGCRPCSRYLGNCWEKDRSRRGSKVACRYPTCRQLSTVNESLCKKPAWGDLKLLSKCEADCISSGNLSEDDILGVLRNIESNMSYLMSCERRRKCRDDRIVCCRSKHKTPWDHNFGAFGTKKSVLGNRLHHSD